MIIKNDKAPHYDRVGHICAEAPGPRDVVNSKSIMVPVIERFWGQKHGRKRYSKNFKCYKLNDGASGSVLARRYILSRFSAAMLRITIPSGNQNFGRVLAFKGH